MTFQDAQHRLLSYVRERIQNGDLTERGFARLIGISQPHVHNVLKGARNLSPKMSDSILKLFHLSILDLASIEKVEANIKKRNPLQPVLQMPFQSSPIGPGMPWPTSVNWRERFPMPFRALPVPAGLMMVRLAADPLMQATLGHYDIAIMDTSERERNRISPAGLYAVSRRGETVLRYIRPGAHTYYLVTDAARDSPVEWEQVRIPAGELVTFVKARVLWLGREKDRDLPMAQRGRFLYEAIS